MTSPRPALWLMLTLAGLALSCNFRYLERPEFPIVGVTTTGGREQGVATDDGVLFLARSAQKGPAKVLYWIEGAPIIEAGTIGEVGGGIYDVDLDVDIPTVPISFEPLRTGEPLVLVTIEASGPQRRSVVAADTSLTSGGAVRASASLKLAPEHVGAGVFRDTDAGLALVGLVKGRARYDDGRELLLLAGAADLRHALITPKTAVPERDVRYRADGARRVRVRVRSRKNGH